MTTQTKGYPLEVIFRAYGSRGAVLPVDHNYLYSSAVQCIAAATAGGELGDVSTMPCALT